MTTLQAIVLGLIEGVTEYLPVSSTGHLLMAQRLMGIGTDGESAKKAADAFAVCIQSGAILAVLGLYWPRVKQMLLGLCGKDAEGLRLVVVIFFGFLPAAVIGLRFNDWIEAKLFGLWPVTVAWFVGGVAILAVFYWRKLHPVPKGEKDLTHLTWKMALIVGFLQCVAMCPGTSRSLMTIVGGVLVGLSLQAAVEYSFLLGVVTLTAATLKKSVWKVDGCGEQFHTWCGGAKLMWASFGPLNLFLGVAAATVAAAIAVKWMVGYLQQHGMQVFGWYRIGIAMVAVLLIATGVMQAV